MADNTTLDPGAGGDVIAADDIAGVKYQRVKVNYGGDGAATDVSAANPLPVENITDITLDPTTLAALETVSVANFPAVQPVSDNGASLTVDGTVAVSGTVSVSGPLTDTQLRASAVPVSLASVPTHAVTGPAADGAAVSGNPVRIAGKDGSGNTQDVLTDTAGRQLVSLSRPWTNTGSYRAVTALLSVLAAADTATAGRWWLINPVGSGVAVAVTRVIWYVTVTTAAAHLTAPRITLERVTFTGTASGASLTPSLRVRTTTQGQTADVAAVGSVRTASTGLTLTAGQVEHAILPPTALTGVGVSQPPMQFYGLSERGEDALILAPGEGVVCRQPDAGTTSDGRRFISVIEWEEFTT